MSLPADSSLLATHSHRRFNLLTGRWILVSPHRTQRPWQGQQEPTTDEQAPTYDDTCYLCPGNARAQGSVNPDYCRTFVFLNDFGALVENADDYGIGIESGDEPGRNGQADLRPDNLLLAERATGRCLVLSFAPSHRVTFADMDPVPGILAVVAAWSIIFVDHVLPGSLLYDAAQETNQAVRNQMATILGRSTVWLDGLDRLEKPKRQYRYLQILENRGAAMGCSNRHPHGQVWVTDILPDEPRAEMVEMGKYRRAHCRTNSDCGHTHGLLEAYAATELKANRRVVFETDWFVVVCPWWASWPFELLVLARPRSSQPSQNSSADRPTIRSLLDLCDDSRLDLAKTIHRIAVLYDNLFQVPFPYSLGIHQAGLSPTDDELDTAAFHIHFYPPLLRSATVRKFWASYELLVEAQRDLTPEVAVERMRACDGQLYRTRSK